MLNASIVSMFYGNFETVFDKNKADWAKLIDAELYKSFVLSQGKVLNFGNY